MTAWPGCHGVRLSGDGLDVGRCEGDPLRDASIAIGADVSADVGDLLWEIRAEVPTPTGVVDVHQWLRRRPNGRFVLRSTSGHSVVVDAREGTISVDGRDDAARLQLLTTFALPLVLIEAPVLILHAAAAVLNDRAVVICGESGRGKSSALVGLIEAGHTAISEDLCAIDLRTDPPEVWPGPPWVRCAPDRPAPEGSESRFSAPDKVAWDIARVRASRPVPLGEIVFLDEPGGDTPSVQGIPTSAVVADLARHAVWLGPPEDRGAALFTRAVDVASAAPARRVQLPFSSSWVNALVAAIA